MKMLGRPTRVSSEELLSLNEKSSVGEEFNNVNDVYVISLRDIVANIYGGAKGEQYRGNVLLERNKLVEALNSFKGNNTSVKILKGNIAEHWHAGTFNINAAQKGAKHRVKVDGSHELGSVDISSNFDKKFGLKYYKNAEETGKQQAKSVLEAYSKYKAKTKNPITLEEFLEKNGYQLANVNDPIYGDQIRVVPKDQLDEIKKWLERKTAEESSKGSERADQVKRYQNTLDMINDKINDGKATSIPLTKEEAEEIAKRAKEGKITSKVIEMTDSEVIRLNYVVANAAKVGLQAAAVTAGVSLVLSVYSKYQEGISFENYTEYDWKDILGSTLFATSTAGISATTLSVVGSFCSTAVPGASALLMAVLGIASLVPDYVDGKLAEEEFIVEAEMVCLDAALILLGTAVGQMTIPLPGLGALIGAIAAGIAWQIIDKFWGNELRELLTAFNEEIDKLLSAIRDFFVGVWEAIENFFKKLAEHIDLLLDEDFNYNLRNRYRNLEAIKKTDKISVEHFVYEDESLTQKVNKYFEESEIEYVKR